ncbi:MAG: protein of unknown function transrane [Bacillota bacterium]|jgi:O-acetylserine/cysteine efflux transporter|nr:protein of unknown function transrane [Bacillota bacterium]
MNQRDRLLALMVVIVWGANFTVIKLGLSGVPPMLLVALRYILAAVPAIFFVKRPSLRWQTITAYGITVGVGQFTCLFLAINQGMPAGVASVVLQSQAFFTFFFAAVFLKESIKVSQLIGLAAAGFGLFLIGANGGNGDTLAAIPVMPFFLTVLGAAFWGLSNIIVRYADIQSTARGEKLDMLSLVVWSSLVPPIPLLVFAILLDPPGALLQVVLHLNGISVFAILYLAFCATLFGYYTWSTLLGKYPAGKVAPLSLLVPITGLITAQLVLGEELTKMQWLGCMVILAGLVITNFGEFLLRRVSGRTDKEHHREKNVEE